MSPGYGVFTVSLDFELYWGVRDKRTINEYGENLRGVRGAIPEMLRVFGDHDIHATWAVVGFLFCNDTAELKASFPAKLPTYERPGLSPYEYIHENASLDGLYHFAPELIKRLAGQSGQEIGTHTFSHFYCLENGQNLDQFEEDISAASRMAAAHGLSMKSLVFPRNQWNEKYLSSLPKFGVQCYRGNQTGRIYEASDAAGQGRVKRAVRLVDAYLNLSGHNTYTFDSCIPRAPFNFPASSFLRPYARKLAILEGLRLRRIKKAMTHAAVNKRLYHLWWHPHNFGKDVARNIEFLEKIAEHYRALNRTYGFRSLNMGELSQLGETHGKQ
ncbi:Polysaccharide deacetylase [Caballeronia choica]|uniref:Polysaccharide deacetylase n=1 Tax=Caballeronia choica TaxID=326476 RepID=A0A158KZR6_9BURK|nr:polysaccharide deacetylase family protein [Caballeronia choica]SAL86213.1 Polysaccharide deacetylase [Caballeronia choica]